MKWAGAPLAVIDCFGILSDETIRRYFELGCEVKALGRGHIQRIKEQVRAKPLRRRLRNSAEPAPRGGDGNPREERFSS